MRIKHGLIIALYCCIGLSSLTGCGNNTPIKPTPDTIGVNILHLGANPGLPTDQLQYNGTLQADKTIDLSFQVSGTITALPVQTGQYVSKGQLVAQVDETVYRNQYNAQLAQSKLAQENYARILEVFKKGSIAEIKMLEARSNYEQASSAAQATYQNIVHTRLLAPQNGYIGARKVEAGATASPGMPVVQLLDIRTVQVLVAVPESEINRYHAGDPALVTIDALGTTPTSGHISEIGVLALDNNASYNVKVNLINTGKQLKPGMLCKVAFLPAQHNTHPDTTSQQVVVPSQAVQVDEKGQTFVYVLNPAGNEALRKEVQAGPLFNNGIAIKSGLSGNERLITSGFQKLGNRTPVTIIK